MGWESFGVVRFDLGPLVQGHTRIAKLKSAYNSLIKCHARDACLYMGEATPQDQHFLFTIALQP